MQHEAIYALYANVKSILGEGSAAIARDDNGNVVSWDASAVATKEAELLANHNLEILRYERNLLLAETDWWELPTHAPMSSERTTYRQSLRDITKTYKSMDDAGFSWPTKPS